MTFLEDLIINSKLSIDNKKSILIEYGYKVWPRDPNETIYVNKEGDIFRIMYALTSKPRFGRPGISVNNVGYLQLCYAQRKVALVHRIVLETFNPTNDPEAEVDHIDFDKTNNHIDNIRWCTRGFNVARSLKGKKKSLEQRRRQSASMQKHLKENPRGKEFSEKVSAGLKRRYAMLKKQKEQGVNDEEISNKDVQTWAAV